MKLLFLAILFFNLSVQAQGIEVLLKNSTFKKQLAKNQVLVVLTSDQLNKQRSFYQSSLSDLINVSQQLTFITTEKDETSDVSCGDIVKYLRELQGSVIVFSEEKASADVLESFLRYPGLAQKVSSFVSVNGYIRGAEYAENLKEPIFIDSSLQAQKLPLVLGIRALLDMAYELFYGFDWVKYSFQPHRRQAYLKEINRKIFALAQKTQLYSITPGEKSYGLLPYSQVIK